jgi:hypothetical protein
MENYDVAAFATIGSIIDVVGSAHNGQHGG